MTDLPVIHTPGDVTPGDILGQPDRNGWAFWAAVAMHGALVGGFVLSKWLAAETDAFGAKDAGGTAVEVAVVNSIPLPTHGPENRLATDTDSEVPLAQPKQQRIQKVAPPPDAVPIKAKAPPKKTAAKEPTEISHVTKFKQLDINQLSSKSAPALSSQSFSVTGAGQLNLGPHTTLGTDFAAYGAQIQQLIATHWHTESVDSRIRSAQQAVFSFDIARDGTIQNIRMVQSSGIPPLDASVQRAIQDSNPLPPLPAGYKHSTASIESEFELKR